MSAAKSAIKAEAQRERILNAARKCFVEHGFHAASMASIAGTITLQVGIMSGLLSRHERHH